MNKFSAYHIILPCIILLTILSGCKKKNSSANANTPQSTYRNPVVTSAAPVSADPDIIRANGTYYLYATTNAWGDGNGPHYMPIFKSDDLVNWMHAGDVFKNIPTWGNADFLWAPDISRREDTYYLYYVSKEKDTPPCIGLATSNNPEGPWKDLEHAVFCSDDVSYPHSIDPFIWDDGETRTMIFGSGKIYAIKLNNDGTAPVAENPAQTKILLANQAEAAYIFRHGAYYYLFVSGGTCCDGASSTYRVEVGRSKSLTGPYIDADGKDLSQGGGTVILAGNEVYAGPGHNTITTDDAGHDWIVYHAIPKDSPRLKAINRRQGMIDRIRWKDGWPVVNNGNGPSVKEMPAPVVK